MPPSQAGPGVAIAASNAVANLESRSRPRSAPRPDPSTVWEQTWPAAAGILSVTGVPRSEARKFGPKLLQDAWEEGTDPAEQELPKTARGVQDHRVGFRGPTPSQLGNGRKLVAGKSGRERGGSRGPLRICRARI